MRKTKFQRIKEKHNDFIIYKNADRQYVAMGKRVKSIVLIASSLNKIDLALSKFKTNSIVSKIPDYSRILNRYRII